MKRGKEIKLDFNENYSVLTGTVDNKNPKAVYIIISAWGNPKSDKIIDYTRVLNNMNKAIKNVLFNNVDDKRFNKDQTIVDLDMRESGIKFNKRSYMSCEITLYQSNNFKHLPVTSKELLDYIKNISSVVLTDAFDCNDYFIFHKTKN